MTALRRESDENNSTDESWMDYSIRMRLRRNENGDGIDDGTDESSSACIAMALPMDHFDSYFHQLGTTSTDDNTSTDDDAATDDPAVAAVCDDNTSTVAEDDQEAIPIAIAELVENSDNIQGLPHSNHTENNNRVITRASAPVPDYEMVENGNSGQPDGEEIDVVPQNYTNEETTTPETSNHNHTTNNDSTITAHRRGHTSSPQLRLGSVLRSSSDEHQAQYGREDYLRREDGVAPTRTGVQQCLGRRRNVSRTSSVSRFIVPRTSLPYTIEHNSMTMEWMAIINTDQENADIGSDNIVEDVDNVVILNVGSVQEAREACHAYAPPRMHSFEDYKNCHICKKKFSKLVRRPWHCQNCGICVCSNCSTSWPASMIPITYQLKKMRKSVKVCQACDWLNDTFRMSLLDGNIDKAVALYRTGNVNLRCPFAKGKNEIYYPVHCAILGGKLSILKWLVDAHCCPIRYREKCPKSDTKHRSRIGNEAIITSKGRSVLTIAMESQSLDIQRYLIVEKRMNIYHYTNLRVALRNLHSCLHQLPETRTLQST